MSNANLSKTPSDANANASEVSPVKVTFYGENNLPKGSKILGNPAKLGSFPILLKPGKLTSFILALIGAGKEGISLSDLSIATYGRVERLDSLKVYFSYDLTKKGLRAAKLPNGNYTLVVRENYTTADLKRLAGIK